MMTWKNFRFVAVFASLALGACAGLTEDGRYSDLSSYERGKLHYNAGQYGLAVKHFRSAVDRERGSVEALNGLAASYDRLGRYDLATRYYGKALGANPESTQTLNNIGYSYLLQKRFDLAVAYLRDAHSRDKKDPVILANRKVAEVAYQEADLKRSAETARAEPTEGLRARPAELVEARPDVRITVAAAPLAPPAPPPRGRVKPWIERTAPTIQTLVTQPQTALLGMVEQAGVSPQLAAYRPQQPTASDLLPDPLTAPLVLDDRPSAALDRLTSSEATAVELDPGEPVTDAPSKPDGPQPATTGLVRPEVTVASLEPVLPRADMPQTVGEPDAPSVKGLVPPEVTVAGLDSLDDPSEEVLLGSDGPGALPVAGLVPSEVTVASLEPVLPRADMPQTVEEPDAPAMAVLVSPEATDDGLDPLDLFEDAPLRSGAPGALPAAASPEVAVASLDRVGPIGPIEEAKRPLLGRQFLPLIEVSNGTGRLSMAARIRHYLESEGLVIRRLTNADTFTHQGTTIFYRAGWKAYAEDLARLLPAAIDFEGRVGQASDIRLELGGDLLNFDRGLYYTVGRPFGAHSG